MILLNLSQEKIWLPVRGTESLSRSRRDYNSKSDDGISHDYQGDRLRDLQPRLWDGRQSSPVSLTQADSAHVAQNGCSTIYHGPCWDDISAECRLHLIMVDSPSELAKMVSVL